MFSWATAFLVLSILGGAVAAQDIDTLGPAVGTRVPAFSAIDQFGRTQTLESVAGPAGTMIVFYRSADW
jgi:hypothetical protein